MQKCMHNSKRYRFDIMQSHCILNTVYIPTYAEVEENRFVSGRYFSPIVSHDAYTYTQPAKVEETATSSFALTMCVALCERKLVRL